MEASPAEFVPFGSDGYDLIIKDCERALIEFSKDPYFIWLYAKIQRASKRPVQVVNEAVLASLISSPKTWILWDSLVAKNEKDLTCLKSKLPKNEQWYNYFMIKRLHSMNRDASAYMAKVKKSCPESIFRLYSAINAYNCRNFEESAGLFQKHFSICKTSLEAVHIFANALFVLGRYPELAQLASRCFTLNRFSAETCAVLGNLWSLMGKHEKAVVSFKRALRMDPDIPSVWVLVGHEYVELRNPSAAISAYLKGTTANPSDYRAWFGLGQVYDLLGSPAQAADYYRRAADLNPKDGRIWSALGMVFEGEEMFEHAIDSYKNALSCHIPDRKLFYRVGCCLSEIGLEEEAIESLYEFLGTRFDLHKLPLDEEDKVRAILRIAEFLVCESPDEALPLLKNISTLQSDLGKRAVELLAQCPTEMI